MAKQKITKLTVSYQDKNDDSAQSITKQFFVTVTGTSDAAAAGRIGVRVHVRYRLRGVPYNLIINKFGVITAPATPYIVTVGPITCRVLGRHRVSAIAWDDSATGRATLKADHARKRTEA